MKIVLFYFIFIHLAFAKEVVVISDLSLNTTKEGTKKTLLELAGILDFSVKNNGKNYLKFGDKVTMAYIDNVSENAGAISSNDAIIDLSRNNFDKNRKYREEYILNVFNYIKKIYKSPRKNVKFNYEKKKIHYTLPQEIIIAVDKSNSMRQFNKKIKNAIDELKDKINEHSIRILEPSINQLATLITMIPNTTEFRQLVLISDGIDDTSENIKLIDKLRNRYEIKPLILSSKWDEQYLKLLSSNNKTYKDITVLSDNLNGKYNKYDREIETVRFENYPKVPIIESLTQLTDQYYLSTKSEKEIFIISSLMQNSSTFSIEKHLNSLKNIDAKKIFELYKKRGMLPNFKGHNINILRPKMGIYKENSQLNILDNFFRDFLKLCGAKKVTITTGNFKL